MAGPGPKRPSTTPKRPAAPANNRSSSNKKNSSILSFFKKTDGPQSTQARITQFGVKVPRADNKGDRNQKQYGDKPEDTSFDALFVEDRRRQPQNLVDIRENGQWKARQVDPIKPSSSIDDFFGDPDDIKENDVTRFNESGGSMKRRKVDTPPVVKQKEQRGPFIDESDSEEESEYSDIVLSTDTPKQISSQPTPREPPPLVREATSNFEPGAVADDFEDIEDDELEGEDFMDRPWADGELEDATDDNEVLGDESACPICQNSLAGLSDSVRWLLRNFT